MFGRDSEALRIIILDNIIKFINDQLDTQKNKVPSITCFLTYETHFFSDLTYIRTFSTVHYRVYTFVVQTKALVYKHTHKIYTT